MRVLGYEIGKPPTPGQRAQEQVVVVLGKAKPPPSLLERFRDSVFGLLVRPSGKQKGGETDEAKSPPQSSAPGLPEKPSPSAIIRLIAALHKETPLPEPPKITDTVRASSEQSGVPPVAETSVPRPESVTTQCIQVRSIIHLGPGSVIFVLLKTGPEGSNMVQISFSREGQDGGRSEHIGSVIVEFPPAFFSQTKEMDTLIVELIRNGLCEPLSADSGDTMANKINCNPLTVNIDVCLFRGMVFQKLPEA